MRPITETAQCAHSCSYACLPYLHLRRASTLSALTLFGCYHSHILLWVSKTHSAFQLRVWLPVLAFIASDWQKKPVAHTHSLLSVTGSASWSLERCLLDAHFLSPALPPLASFHSCHHCHCTCFNDSPCSLQATRFTPSGLLGSNAPQSASVCACSSAIQVPMSQMRECPER